MGPFKILVVDDEIDFMETLIKRMRKRNFDVTGVESGEDALKLLEKQDFDIVLLDVKMPQGMDGMETLREIRQIKPHIEVVLLTGHASIETSIEGKKLGVFDYLLKPIILDDLLVVLSAAFEKKEKGTL
jgi:DNA-binding NtrC family response regulator